MKRKLKLLTLGVAFFSLLGFFSCSGDDDPTAPAAPTELMASNITASSATLSWVASASAESYEIALGAESFPTSAVIYNLTDLNPNTEYEWKVRAKAGDLYSEWVVGTKFTTEAPAPSAIVKFGDQTWDVVASYAEINYDDPLIYVELYSNDPEATGTVDFPFVTFAILGNSVGVYDRQVDAFVAPDGNIDINYFENMALMEEWGDWWADPELENSIEITSIENSKISGTLNANIFDVMLYATEFEFDYKVLEIEFSNIPLSQITGTSPVRKFAKKDSPKNIKNINLSSK